MPFYMDRFVFRQTEKGYMWDQWRRAGYTPGDAFASFTGSAPKNYKLFEHDKLFNKYKFSSFNFTRKDIDEIISTLNQLKPKFLHGYPSTLTSLAKLVSKSNKRLTFSPKAIFCGSEKTFQTQREILESVFQSKVYSWYGHSEYCVLGGECEFSKSFHLYPQYGFVEFLPVDVCHESGEQLYEIVTTGFNNWIMPFIRYKTADYVILDTTPCKCDRNYPMIKEVVGRLQEFLVDMEENLISLSAVTSLSETLPFIDEISLVQDKPGTFEFLILPSYLPSEDEVNGLVSRIMTTTQNRLVPEVHFVDAIHKAPSGKRLLLNQKLDLSLYL